MRSSAIMFKAYLIIIDTAFKRGVYFFSSELSYIVVVDLSFIFIFSCKNLAFENLSCKIWFQNLVLLEVSSVLVVSFTYLV